MANIKIKINNLLNNIRIIKNSYNYDYLIMDVRNNAFNHGMYITKYLEDIDYFYVDSLSDVISLRKYLKKADIIYKGRLSEENIYDLILNEAILVLDNIDILKNLEINEEIRVILDINKDNNIGINTQEKVKNIKEYFKEKIKYKIEGIMAHIKEDEYLEYKEIMYPLKDVKLKILNNESDKQKIKISNAIKLDNVLYGINEEEKSRWKKKERIYKQSFELEASITMIKKKIVKRKEVFLASIDVGYLNGMSKDITKVYYKNEYLEVVEVLDEYSLIKVDKEARVGECVEITGDNNSLDRYLDNISVARFNVFGNIPVSYKVGEKVKTPIY